MRAAPRRRPKKKRTGSARSRRLFGPGEKLARDLAYADAMKRMHDKYPADDEVTSFYALAILGTSHGGRDFSIYMRAAALVEQVYAKNPQHPGAAHYLIHAYDDPVHAPLGLRYADAYSKIAPSASHALHMPSHIYVAMGMWDESAAINERSVKAADARREAKKLDVDQRGFHALLWLVYSYTQQGRYEDARGILAQMEAAAKESGSERTRSHLALARAAWLIETRKWGEAKAPVVVEGPAEGRRDRRAVRDRFRGRAIGQSRGRRQRDAADGGADGGSAGQRRAGAQHAVGAPARAGRRADRPGPGGGAATRHAGQSRPRRHRRRPGTRRHTRHRRHGLPTAGAAGDPRVPQVMAQQLEAALLFAEGRREEALVLARQAAVVEAGLPFEFGPPVPVKPVNEQVGEMLMDLRRPREAMEAFELSLKRTPRRTLSLLGLARAAMAVEGHRHRAARLRRAQGHLEEGGQDAAGAERARPRSAAKLVSVSVEVDSRVRSERSQCAAVNSSRH